MKEFVQGEKQQRKDFLDSFGRVLPSVLLPSIKDDPPHIKQDGKMSEYSLPDLDDLDDGTIDPLLPKMHFREGGEAASDQNSRLKFNDEIKLLKKEHQSNIEGLREELQNTENMLKLKVQTVLREEQKTKDIEMSLQKTRSDFEKQSRSFKDLASQHKIAQRITEESLARKTKEVEALQKERKCRNCVLCLNDLKDKSSHDQLQDMNDLLRTKMTKIATLEDSVRKAHILIS
jgi:hypothetical protein